MQYSTIMSDFLKIYVYKKVWESGIFFQKISVLFRTDSRRSETVSCFYPKLGNAPMEFISPTGALSSVQKKHETVSERLLSVMGGTGGNYS